MSMLKHGQAVATLLVGIISMGLFTLPATAGDFRCWFRCEAEISPDPIEKTIVSRVEIEPGLYEVEREPAQYGWIKKRVIVSGNYKDQPVYETVKRRILLKQYKNIAVYHRGKYKYIRENVLIYPEETGWSYFSSKD